MLRLYQLLFLALFFCSASLSGMYGPNNVNNLARLFQQVPLLPGASIEQTGIIETVVRDAFCGGSIKASVIAAIMVALLVVDQESPCNLACFWKILVGCICVLWPSMWKAIGSALRVANNNPTERAVVWRDRCRLAYGLFTIWAVLNSEFLFEKCIGVPSLSLLKK